MYIIVREIRRRNQETLASPTCMEKATLIKHISKIAATLNSNSYESSLMVGCNATFHDPIHCIIFSLHVCGNLTFGALYIPSATYMICVYRFVDIMYISEIQFSCCYEQSLGQKVTKVIIYMFILKLHDKWIITAISLQNIFYSGNRFVYQHTNEIILAWSYVLMTTDISTWHSIV